MRFLFIYNFVILHRCSYDYLEIIDSYPSDYHGHIVNGNHTTSTGFNDNFRHHTQRMENVSKHNETSYAKNVDIFDNFLNIYKSHHSYLIQTPEMGINFDKSLNVNAPRRICGDWNSKVRFIQHIRCL